MYEISIYMLKLIVYGQNLQNLPVVVWNVHTSGANNVHFTARELCVVSPKTNLKTHRIRILANQPSSPL